jgi:drug/metabolite transporter (DMT)-like permease
VSETWLWIPITIAAALLQNIRTALQKHLKGRLSTNAATYTRYVFGFPLAIAYVAVLAGGFGVALPEPNWAFFGWMALGAVTQIVATSLLLYAFTYKNFAVGVAYSKTEVIQAAVFGLVFLGETVTGFGAAAIVLGTAGVMLMSLDRAQPPLRAFLLGWMERPALIGIASGGVFAISAVAFRAGSLALGHPSFLMAAAFTVLAATVLQTALLTVYLRLREPGQIGLVFRHWRVASLPSIAGVLGTICWLTAMTLQSVAYVRTLGLIELVFTFMISVLAFRETPTRNEVLGVVLLVAGIALVLNVR